MQTRSVFRRGLSLIELLVLLSTLALVAAIIGPAISQQQGESRRTHEMDNLRVLAQLMAKYSADDPQGVLGPVHPADKFFSGGTGFAEYGGGPGTMPYGGWGAFHDPAQPGDQMPFDPRTRPLNFYLYGRDRITPGARAGDPNVFKPFQCLGDDLGFEDIGGFGPEDAETPYFQITGTSFRLNNLSFGSFSTGLFGRTLNRIPFPSQTLGLLEARAYQTLWTNSVSGVFEPVQLAGYHKRPGFFLTTYADGHVLFADFGIDSYYPSLLTPGTYAGTDARGIWGRMDCWPDPPISAAGTPMAPEGVNSTATSSKLTPTTTPRPVSTLQFKGDEPP